MKKSMKPKLVGVEKAIKALERKAQQVNKRTTQALDQAGLLVLRRSQKLVPVDTGILKNSGFTEVTVENGKPVVHIGYRAAYAIYVHENLAAAHGETYNKKYAAEIKAKKKGFNKRGKGQMAQFLALAWIDSVADIRRLLAKALRTGKTQKPKDETPETGGEE